MRSLGVMRRRSAPFLVAVALVIGALLASGQPMAIAAEEAPPTTEASATDETAESEEVNQSHPDDDAWWYMDEYNIGFDPTDPEIVFREIIFPVIGEVGFSAGFGNCREACSRPHNGIDIMTYGWKGLPVVAVTDGVITYTGTKGRLAGCSVTLRDADGWTSHYMHLNNDRPGTDREEDLCFAPGIEVGARVKAGTLLGWVGDSGNAETTPPHLHFEIRTPEGIPIDSYVSLEPAPRIDYAFIDTADMYDLGTALYGDAATTAYVIEEAGFIGAVRTAAASYDSPIIPIDPLNAEPALEAVRELAPARVFIFSEVIEPHYLDDIELTVDVVEVSTFTLPEPEVEEEIDGTPEAADTSRRRPVHIHEPIEPWMFTVVADDDTRTLDTMSENSDRLLAFSTQASIPDDLGYAAGDRPSEGSNRDGFWWPSADGWLLTSEIPDEPDVRVAVVTDIDDEATMNFVRSAAEAPLMPLWHYAPSYRTRQPI